MTSTLSDCSLGWGVFFIEEFDIRANTCVNHSTGIPAANYSQAKYYVSREVYDEMYDIMVNISKLGLETLVRKAHEAVPRYLIEHHDDKAGADYFQKTWSIDSGHGKWAICH